MGKRQEEVNEKFKLILFTIYTILYECLIWGGFFYIVFVFDGSAWWAALAVFMSSAQLKPKHFGLPYNLKDKTMVQS